MKKALLLVLLVVTPVAQAGVSKWVDADGKVHYGDQPPADSRDVKTLAIQSTATGTAGKPAEAKTTAEKERDFRKRRLEGEEAEKKRLAAENETKLAAENCKRAQSWVRALEDGVRVKSYTPQGEAAIMDDAGRSDALKKARQDVAQWCK